MDDNLKELLAQKKRSLKQSSKEQRSSNTKTILQKASNIFLKNAGTQMKRKRSNLENSSQNSISHSRDNCQSKKFARTPTKMFTCAF